MFIIFDSVILFLLFIYLIDGHLMVLPHSGWGGWGDLVCSSLSRFLSSFFWGVGFPLFFYSSSPWGGILLPGFLGHFYSSLPEGGGAAGRVTSGSLLFLPSISCHFRFLLPSTHSWRVSFLYWESRDHFFSSWILASSTSLIMQ